MTDRFEPVRALLRQACGPVFPGCSVAVVQSGEPRLVEAFGALGTGSVARHPATPDTLYDVASLSKALVTTPLAIQLLAEGHLAFDLPLRRYVPGLDPRVTIGHLLTHTAGFAAWRPFFLELVQEGRALLDPARARARVLARLQAEPPPTEPGAREVYSDLGYLVLGWALEAAGGAPLDRLFAERIARPLGLQARFGPLPEKTGVAPTEAYAGRPLAVGVVHDDNAFALGGVEGHAGLFATARDAAAIGAELLRVRRGSAESGARVFDPATVRAFVDAARPALPRTRISGFDTPTPGASSAGASFGREAFGHLGFTGCSWWCDPRRDLVVVLLSNRVHPTRRNEAIRAFRPRFHDAVAGAVGL